MFLEMGLFFARVCMKEKRRCQNPLNTKQVINWSPGGNTPLTITGSVLVYVRTR